MFAPQLVPPVTGVVVGVQTGAPEPHSICDWTQAPAGVQSWPWVQEMHVPVPLHTRFVPQEVPAEIGVVVSVQTGEPVSHEITAA